MRIGEIMTKTVIKIDPEETVAVAARALTHYNIGALPVCTSGGKLCGVVTDRDLVTRCLAANRKPETTKVKEIMTTQVLSVTPDMQVNVAAHLMGRRQIRRLPVMEENRVCGMVSLGDLAAREESVMDAADAMSDISSGICEGEQLGFLHKNAF